MGTAFYNAPTSQVSLWHEAFSVSESQSGAGASSGLGSSQRLCNARDFVCGVVLLNARTSAREKVDMVFDLYADRGGNNL